MRARALILSLLLASPSLAVPPKKKQHPPHRPPPAAAAPAPPPASDTPPPSSEAAPAPATESAPPPAAETQTAPPPSPPPAPPPQETQPSGKSVDLDALANEYNQLRDELFRSRAKAHLLGDALFKTRILATFQYKAQRAWPVKKVTLRIDDQPVFSVDAPPVSDPIKLYDGFAAPGRHTLAIKVECGAVGEDRVGYGTEGTFLVDLAEDKQTVVRFVVDESGDGPARLAKKREGTFDVRVRADLETQERPR